MNSNANWYQNCGKLHVVCRKLLFSSSAFFSFFPIFMYKYAFLGYTAKSSLLSKMKSATNFTLEILHKLQFTNTNLQNLWHISTVWNFCIFLLLRFFLREINFGDWGSAKNVVFSIFETLNFEFLSISAFKKCKNS